jgi:hypothetical protein
LANNPLPDAPAGCQGGSGLIRKDQLGSFASARATATLCCCPPERASGGCQPGRRPQISEQFHRALVCGARSNVIDFQGDLHVFKGT